MFMYKFLGGCLFSFLLGVYLEVHLLGCYVNSVFNIVRKCQTVFQSACTILHSHQQCTSVPIAPQSHQLLLFVFLIIAVLVDMKWLCCCGFDLHFPDD